MIDLVLHNRTKERAWSRAFALPYLKAALPYLKVPQGHTAEIGITIVGPIRIRTLNREHRKKDTSTDVLSFPLHQAPIPGYTAISLGDLFICPAVVRVKARLWKRTVPAQMAWTLVHGLLHLAGYDHEQSDLAAEAMSALEKKIIDSVG